MIKIAKSKDQRSKIAIDFGGVTRRHVSPREALAMAKRLFLVAQKMIDNRRGRYLAQIIVLGLLSGCAGVPRATQGGRVLDIWSQVSTKDFIRVRGIGAVGTGIRGLTARRGASRNAALVSARYELLAVIKGVKLDGGITMAQLIEKDSLIREIANEVVSGGDEVKTEWLIDDGCVVTLELKRSKVERLIKEKSEREKGLERRIEKDLDDIRKLHQQIAEAGRIQLRSFVNNEEAFIIARELREVLKKSSEAKTDTEIAFAIGDIGRLLRRIEDGH